MTLRRIGVLHLVDSLAAGGAEHVAVMLANNLPQNRYQAYICASRQSGELRGKIRPHVMFFDLHRRGRFDILSIFRLHRFVRDEGISIIHAHTTSLFMGVVLGLFNSRLHVVWHDHFGLQETQSRPVFLYRFFARRVQVIFAVTRKLKDWSVQSLCVPQERVYYLPNFVESYKPNSTPAYKLPVASGKCIVCVANIRSQKDHLTLLHAMSRVVESDKHARLVLIGAETDLELSGRIKQEIERLGLSTYLIWMGARNDVPDILSQCDIGVLSSVSEGFPIVLLEYGRAGLAVVATKVGECPEILKEGKAGLLVPPSDPDSLASAILQLLISPDMKGRLGNYLRENIRKEYSVESVERQICQIYEQII